ncbi:MAG: hypothetical protein INR62_02360, partial [Rhodospirillales bacterium]|nr:hypothetical protein [Acetobacter sp.]
INSTIFAAKTAVASGAEEGVAAGLSPFIQAAENLSGRIEGQLRRSQRLVFASALILLLMTVLVVFCVAFELRR